MNEYNKCYTGFSDGKKKKLYLGSLVKGPTGEIYLVKSDDTFTYVLYNVSTSTIEKLTDPVSRALTLIVEDVRAVNLSI